jgi:hypothetical protein
LAICCEIGNCLEEGKKACIYGFGKTTNDNSAALFRKRASTLAGGKRASRRIWEGILLYMAVPGELERHGREREGVKKGGGDDDGSDLSRKVRIHVKPRITLSGLPLPESEAGETIALCSARIDDALFRM